MIIATAGHIDHGKTSLVRALTGVETDRLKEEKLRGMTIELGFAYRTTDTGRRIGFVDVPGHAHLIPTMVSGLSGAGAVLFVIAADEGIKPQTREHVQIASLLGLSRGLVALTKCDALGRDDRSARMADITAFLSLTPFRNCPILPVSSRTGEGMDALWSAIQAMAESQANDPGNRPSRLHVDRVFSIVGSGTVVTGPVVSGAIHTGDRLLLLPSGRTTRVRGLHAMQQPAPVAHSGERAALNLPDLAVEDIPRGAVLADPDHAAEPTSCIDVAVTFGDAQARIARHGSPVHVHCGSAQTTGRLVILDDGAEPILGRLTLDRAMPLLVADRIIVRDAQARATLGGATVLDLSPPARHRRTRERVETLRAIHKLGALDALPIILERAPFAIDYKRFLTQTGVSPEELQDAISRHSLIALKADTVVWIMAGPVLLRLHKQILACLSACHADHPDQPGMAQDRLRLHLKPPPGPAIFDAILQQMNARRQIGRVGHWVHLPGHLPQRSAADTAVWSRVEPMLSGEQRLAPPRVPLLADATGMRADSLRRVLKRMAREGSVVEIADDQFLLRTTVMECATAVRKMTSGGETDWFSAAQYRDHLGIGRKMAILILEFFDRQGLTLRKGDLRRVDPRRSRVF